MKKPSFRTLLSRISASSLDLLFPIQCAGCGKESRVICEECIPHLATLSPPYCNICASPRTTSPCRACVENPPEVDGVRAPYLFEGPIREAVHRFKYQGLRAAAPDLGRLLAEFLAHHRVPGEVIVPVPLHSRRLRQRGYNQAALLARHLAKLTGLELNEGLLVCTTETSAQVETASRSQRRDNVKGNFRCEGDVSGLRVILVDDVATTGSTLSACAAALKASGAASVWGLVLAR